jgi:hypothetical protein
MFQRQFAGMQIEAGRRRAAVQSIAENRKAFFGSVNADLVRASGQWFSLQSMEAIPSE